MDNSTLAIDNSKRRHTSSPHTSSQSDEHARLRHTDTSRSTLVTGTPARNHRAIIRWWIVSCISFLVCTPLVSVLLGLHLHARDFQYLDNNFTFPGRTIMFEAILISADPTVSTMTMDWNIIGESQSSCSSTNLEACTDINVFFDNNLLIGGDPSVLQTSDRPTDPIFRFNASAFAQKDVLANTATFRTNLALFSTNQYQSNLLYYPFDTYSAEICIFATDATTNETLGLKIAQTRGIAVGFKTNAYTRPDIYIPPGVADIIVILSRGNLVKAFSIVATLSIWSITLILLLVMITAVFFGFRQRGEVLMIPVGTLFAFTQLRQSMPGAPAGFGDIIDFVGLLPCLALLSLCAAFTLGSFILTDPTEKPHHFTLDLWYEAFPGLRPKQQAKGKDADA